MRTESMELLRWISKQCEHPTNGLVSRLLNRCWYWVMILVGERFYHQLECSYPGYTFLFTPTASIGDLCYLKRSIEEIIKGNQITTPYLLLVEESVSNVAEYLNFAEILSVRKTQLFPLVMFHNLYIEDTPDLINCFCWEFHYPMKLNSELEYQSLTYRLSSTEVDDNLISSIGDLSKMVVLAPYEKTISLLENQKLSTKFWELLAVRISECGYDVYTNCSSEMEQPINGTYKLCVPLEVLPSYIKSSVALIAIRSGLVDFLSDVDVSQIILYPSIEWYERFTLKFVASKKLEEVIYKPYLTHQIELVDIVVSMICDKEDGDVF